MEIETKTIFEFTDYRAFLKDVYKKGKQADARFAHRYMSKMLGFSSPNYIKLVMDGERNLSPPSLEKVIGGFGFKKKEAEYFRHLVAFDQAKSSEQKNSIFNLISAFRTRSTTADLHSNQYEYYSNWYNSVVREIIVGEPEEVDYKKLAKKIVPAILPKEVKKSVQLLNKLKLIHLDNKGCYRQSSSFVQAVPKVHNLSIRNYHHKMGENAVASIESVHPEKRNISSVTVKVSQKGYKKIADRVDAFREELLSMVHADKDVSDVYQLNFQLFPLTRDMGDKK